MKSSYETIIRSPMEKVFLTVADLARWPEFLPHYRYNRFIRQTASSGLVEMSCYRLGLSAEVGFRVSDRSPGT